MDLTTILVIVNLSFQVLERIFTYSYKHTKFHSECMGNKLDIDTEKKKDLDKEKQ
jgi:hypothetical protein